VATWIPGTVDGPTEFASVLGIRANLFEAYRDFAARIWAPEVMDAPTLERCRLRVAAVLGCAPELRVRTSTAVTAGLTETTGAVDERTQRCLDTAEQFVLDPGGLTSAERRALRDDLGMSQLVGLTNALAVFDGFDRFRMVLGITEEGRREGGAEPVVVDPGRPDPAFDVAPSPPLDSEDPAVAFSAAQPALFASFQRLYAVLWSGGVVDHPSKEVARLRNARITGCRFCRNVRFDQARRDGLTEELVDLIADGFEASELAPEHKAVIRLADIFLTEPRQGVPPPLQQELLEQFGAAGVVELTAGLALFMGFSKIAVALGAFPEDFETTVIDTPRPVPAAS
jgi:AhpD family alkylhydroperoxidase